MADLLSFFAFYVNNLPCGHSNDFKFNNGGGLLSSVLLFTFDLKKIIDFHLWHMIS